MSTEVYVYQTSDKDYLESYIGVNRGQDVKDLLNTMVCVNNEHHLAKTKKYIQVNRRADFEAIKKHFNESAEFVGKVTSLSFYNGMISTTDEAGHTFQIMDDVLDKDFSKDVEELYLAIPIEESTLFATGIFIHESISDIVQEVKNNGVYLYELHDEDIEKICNSLVDDGESCDVDDIYKLVGLYEVNKQNNKYTYLYVSY